jgi:hypothetical protein
MHPYGCKNKHNIESKKSEFLRSDRYELTFFLIGSFVSSFKAPLLMVTIETYRKLALSFPDTVEQPHFDIPSFRYKGKIFSTLWLKDNRAMLKLSPVEQSVYCEYDPAIFFPVPNAWGAKGATLVELSKVKKTILLEAMTAAYNGVAVAKAKMRK